MTVQLSKQVIQDEHTAKGKEAAFISLFHDMQTVTVKLAFLVPSSQAAELFLKKKYPAEPVTKYMLTPARNGNQLLRAGCRKSGAALWLLHAEQL